MRWSEIKGDVWTIPRERVKNRKKSVPVYLSPLVLRILRRRKTKSDLLFPSRSGVLLNSKVCARLSICLSGIETGIYAN
jgi:integrase